MTAFLYKQTGLKYYIIYNNMKSPFLEATTTKHFWKLLKKPTYQNYSKETFRTFNEEHAKNHQPKQKQTTTKKHTKHLICF